MRLNKNIGMVNHTVSKAYSNPMYRTLTENQHISVG